MGIENGATYTGDIVSEDYANFSGVEKYIPVSIPTANMDAEGNLWSPWFTYDAKSKIYVSAGYQSGQINMYFDYQFDNRAVDISSNIEPTYYKDQNGARQPNPHVSPGASTGDTVATWDAQQNSWYWDGSFQANLYGSWDDPSYTWTGSLLGTQGDFPTTTSGFLVNLSSPSTIGVAVQDTDDRNINATYTMRFHKPHENDHEYKDPTDEAPGVFIGGNPIIESVTANPAYAIHGGSIALNWTNNPYAEVLDSDEVQTAVDVVGTLDIGDVPVEAIAIAAGMSINDLTPTVNQQPVSYDVCWYDNDPVTDNPIATWDNVPIRPDDTHLSDYQMTPHIAAGYKLHFIHYDNYGKQGYIGEQKIAVETLKSEGFYGEFKSIGLGG